MTSAVLACPSLRDINPLVKFKPIHPIQSEYRSLVIHESKVISSVVVQFTSCTCLMQDEIAAVVLQLSEILCCYFGQPKVYVQSSQTVFLRDDSPIVARHKLFNLPTSLSTTDCQIPLLQCCHQHDEVCAYNKLCVHDDTPAIAGQACCALCAHSPTCTYSSF